MNAREVSWRVFADEYNSSTMEHQGEGEKPVSYVVTPLGARINRMLVIGVITEIEDVGDGDKPRYRARLADPTGTFYISAGEYQPEAAAALSKMSAPAFAAVVGKSRVYSPEEGVKYLSIRPERIAEVDAAARDYWVLETARSTLARIEAMGEATNMSQPTVSEMTRLGFPEGLADGVLLAAEYYRDVDLERFKGVVKDALRTVMPDGADASKAQASERKKGPAPPPPKTSEEPKEQSPAREELQELEVGADEEETVLGIIDALDNGQKGAQWEKIVEAAEAKKIDKVRLEEIISALLDKGDVYEPELGMMKRI